MSGDVVLAPVGEVAGFIGAALAVCGLREEDAGSMGAIMAKTDTLGGGAGKGCSGCRIMWLG